MSSADAMIGITVNQHILLQQQKHPKATGELSKLLTEIIVAAKVIRHKVTLAGIAEVVGATGDSNVQGEQVQILDVLSNELMTKRLLSSQVVSMIVSEEDEEPHYSVHPFPPLNSNGQNCSTGKYAVAMDPLDGSSNIACNIPVGTIFGIWKRKKASKEEGTRLEEFTGNKMVAAGYVLYGPSSMLVYTTGNGTHGFTYDPSVGEFVLTHENMKIPKVCKCYSVNEAYYFKWDKGCQDLVTWMKTPDKETNRPYTGRYVGSLVADFHRNLLYGGIYLYPNEKGSKAGKLRLLYEAAPLSFIAMQSGGKGTNGEMDILDIVPDNIHQRVSLVIGNADVVDVCHEFLSGKREL